MLYFPLNCTVSLQSAEVFQWLNRKDRGGSSENDNNQKGQSDNLIHQLRRGDISVKYCYCKRQGGMIKDCWMEKAADHEKLNLKQFIWTYCSRTQSPQLKYPFYRWNPRVPWNHDTPKLCICCMSLNSLKSPTTSNMENTCKIIGVAVFERWNLSEVVVSCNCVTHNVIITQFLLIFSSNSESKWFINIYKT